MRFFNTAGVCHPDKHYMIPATGRLPGVHTLVHQEAYFVVHAPRQTGKTTSLRALCAELTAEGRYAALHFSCEVGEAWSTDPAAAERAVWRSLALAARTQLPAALRPHDPPRDGGPGTHLYENLQTWALACPLPLVLVFDEIDALLGDALIAVLRQLRAGHPDRPGAFPSSVVLCGLRDVRDYKLASGGDMPRLGSPSPFNVLVKSLQLGSFTADEVARLYAQHTAETGQAFATDAVERAWELTQGQPWLTNALAREVVEEMGVTGTITAAHLDRAAERLILARATHLDSLASKLHEPRVRRVIGPLLEGSWGGSSWDDDVDYVADLGLVTRTDPTEVANPIYREVMVRVLSATAQRKLRFSPTRTFVRDDGSLNLRRVLEEFASFWREHGEILADGLTYHEVAAQLVLMAWLQRVVNGGGYVQREYGVGRGRIDLLVRWPLGEGRWQREALELKVWAEGRRDPLDKGLAQLDAYLDRLELDTGVLVIFDRRPVADDPEVRTRFAAATTPAGREVTLLRA